MSDEQAKAKDVAEVKLWDPALRIFHWALVFFFTTSFLLGKFGPSVMTLHFWSGYAICGLLAFRVIWGLVGPRSARFSNFVPGPAAVLGYLRQFGKRTPSYWPGHNPMGALAVVAILVLLIVQVVTGLVSDPEDYVNVGPLAHLVDIDTNRTANAWHETISNLLLALVVLHIGAIVYYRVWKREDLVGPMIHGRKTVRTGEETSE